MFWLQGKHYTIVEYFNRLFIAFSIVFKFRGFLSAGNNDSEQEPIELEKKRLEDAGYGKDEAACWGGAKGDVSTSRLLIKPSFLKHYWLS